MTERVDAFEILQHVYFDSISSGDIDRAASALHRDVNWSHQRVWQHRPGDTAENVYSRSEVATILASRKGNIAGLQYTVTDLAWESNHGGFLGHVGDTLSEPVPFIGWLELLDGEIRRYIVRPLE